MLGTGRGRVSQAPLAEEIVDFLETVEKIGGGARMNELRKEAKRFFLNYMKAVAGVFPRVGGRKYSIKTGAALRAFIRVAPDVMARARELSRDAFDYNADPRRGASRGASGCATAASRPRASGRPSSPAAPAAPWRRSPASSARRCGLTAGHRPATHGQAVAHPRLA
jgi:hypothetical protein